MQELLTKEKVFDEIKIGEWSQFQCLTKEVKAVFEKALEGFIGVIYTPVAYACMLNDGMYYRFVCNARSVYPELKNEAAIVTIYHGSNDSPHLTDIKRVYF